MPPASCPETGARGDPLIGPIIAYPHTAPGGVPLGTVVIGGYVYRGTALTDLLGGDYVFADFSTTAGAPRGQVYAAREAPPGTWTPRTLAVTGMPSGLFIRAFGEDAAGELYVLASASFGPVGDSGAVYRFVRSR